MATNTIQHGTRSGYRHGCRDNKDGSSSCPAYPNTCHKAANRYQADLRAARTAARSRVRPQGKPHTPGMRVVSGMPRSEPRDTRDLPGSRDTGPIPDMATYDAPESLVNAQTDPDPEPSESADDIYNQPLFVVTPGMKNDIAGKLGLFAAIIGMPFEAIDPYCGGVFAANVDNMIDAYLPIITRSPGAVKFFMSKSGGWLDWINALKATWPVFLAVYAHHLGKTVGKDKRPMPDATMPPQAEDFQYTAA